MENFPYRDGRLYAEDIPVSDIASAHGTPCYIYSRAALESAFGEYQGAPEYVASVFMVLASLPFVRYVQLLAGSAQYQTTRP